MPELPEVETIVRQLDKVLPGKMVDSIEILREKSLQGQSSKLIGNRIKRVSRKQKIIAIELEKMVNGKWQMASDVLLVHLKMTGQLIFQPLAENVRGSKYVVRGNQRIKSEQQSTNYELRTNRIVGGHPTKDWVGKLPSKHTRVIIRFTDGSVLYFNDQRVFGWIKVVSSHEWRVTRAKMAPDVVDMDFTEEYLAKVLKSSKRPVKLVILDQDKIGGMGNIYANDALFLAKINPLMPAYQVKPRAVKKLYQAMIEVINLGIETGGSSISHYVDTEGIGGHYQDHFLVYDKAGEVCQKCGHLIEKISLGGRGTYFCPSCQH